MPLNEHEWILLNAYLDGELPPKEHAAIAARLASDPALREELDSLRQTVALVGMAERRPLPRRFMLDPKVYGRPVPRQRMRVALGAAASAVGAVMALALICGGALMAMDGARGAFVAGVRAPAGYGTVLTVVVEGEPAETETAEEAPMLMFESAPAPAEGAGQDSADVQVGAVPTQEPEAAAPSLAQGVPPGLGSQPAESPVGGVGGGEATAPTATAEVTMRGEVTATIPPTPDMAAEIPHSEPMVEQAPTPTEFPTATAWPAPTRTSVSVADEGPEPGLLAGIGMMGLGALVLVVIALAWLIRRR